MLTVQEIQAMSFEKAVFGGYDMKAVEEFVEQLTEDYATLQKENAALKAKMKVLVDKIEEYRSVEEGMRRALVSAQSIAQETIDKAKLEADQLVSTAREESEMAISAYQTRIQAEQQNLQEAKQNCADFTAKMTAFFKEQLQVLVGFSASKELQIERVEAQEMPPETTRNFSKSPEQEEQPDKEYTIPKDIQEYMEIQQPEQENSTIRMTEVTLSDENASEKPREPVTDATSKFTFEELKFGSGYSTKNDR